jgi:hypothetical protein
MKTGFCLEVVLKVSICNFKHFLSPLAPLKKGGTRIKVILKKGDLKVLDTLLRTFQTSS